MSSNFLAWEKDVEEIGSILRKIQREVEEEENKKSSYLSVASFRGGGDGPGGPDFSVSGRTAQYAFSSQLRILHDKILQARIKLKSVKDVLALFNDTEREVSGSVDDYLSPRMHPLLDPMIQLERIRTPTSSPAPDENIGPNYHYYRYDSFKPRLASSAQRFALPHQGPSNAWKLPVRASAFAGGGDSIQNVKSSLPGLFEPRRIPLLACPVAEEAFSDLENISSLNDDHGFKAPETIPSSRRMRPALKTFNELGLCDDLIECLQEMQFGITSPEPSLMQVKAFPVFIEGRDVMLCAPESPDRILTYCLHVMNEVDCKMPVIQTVILTPSGHLGEEVRQTLVKLGKSKKLSILHAKGGRSYTKDLKEMRKGCQILIGHPESVLTLLKKSRILPHPKAIVVIDQAESMLSPAGAATRASIYGIIKTLSSKIQVILSASEYPPDVKIVTAKFMRNPAFVSWQPNHCEGLEPILKTSKHFFINARDENKMTSVFIHLCELFVKAQNKQIIVFRNKPIGVHNLSESLIKEGFRVAYAEGNMSRMERAAVMDKFKSNLVDILVMTDFLCRGIDIQNYDLVCNYDLPPANNYSHRIGDGGLTPRKGITINLVTDKLFHRIQQIEEFADITMRQVDTPSYFENYFT